jgi:hypothetical protein
MEMGRCMLENIYVPNKYWVEAVHNYVSSQKVSYEGDENHDLTRGLVWKEALGKSSQGF